jgi:hypothetical protein
VCDFNSDGNAENGVPDTMKSDQAGTLMSPEPKKFGWDVQGHQLGTIVLPNNPPISARATRTTRHSLYHGDEIRLQVEQGTRARGVFKMSSTARSSERVPLTHSGAILYRPNYVTHSRRREWLSSICNLSSWIHLAEPIPTRERPSSNLIKTRSVMPRVKFKERAPNPWEWSRRSR